MPMPRQERFRKVAEGTWQAARDAYALGPAFAMHGIRQVFSRGTGSVAVPRIGRIAVRFADSDFQTVRQTFRDHQYVIPNRRAREAVARHHAALRAAGRTPVIVDAGANIGTAALWMQATYPGSRVFAVEPDARTIPTLARNAAAAAGIEVVAAAIGCRPGRAALDAGRQSWGSRTRRGAGAIPVTTVPALVDRVPGGTLFLAKIDIEGFEDDLFEDNTEWIDQAAVLIIEPHDWMFPARGTSRNFLRELGRRDMALFVRGENLIFVRRDLLAEDGAAQAPGAAAGATPSPAPSDADSG